MAARRKHSDVEQLSASIARAIRRSKCTQREIVDALMAVAAGRAVVGHTHNDCVAFEDHAHAAFHGAMAVVMTRPGGDNLVN